MNLGHIKIRQKSSINPLTRCPNPQKPTPQKQICQHILQLRNSNSQQTRSQALHTLITQTHSSWTNQFFLCNNLGLPFTDGPISLTPIPPSFQARTNQLMTLFKYLERVKELYVCWMIFLDGDLGVLNLKLMTVYQVGEVQGLFWDGDTLVGVFIGERYYSKARTLSTKTDSIGLGLSSKTTKDSLHKHSKQKSSKNLKSISMKQKKPYRNELGSKLTDTTFSHKSKNHHDCHNKSSSSLKPFSKLETKIKK